MRLALKVILATALALALVTALARTLWMQRSQPKPFRGYTLIAPLASTRTFLIDMQKRVIRTWESSYTAGQDAYLLENGHLLRAGQLRKEERLFEAPAAGGRVQEFTWDGELVWDFKFHNEKQAPHHDIAPLPGGNVLLLVWEKKTPEETIAAGRSPQAASAPWLVDAVLEIKPTGKTTGEIVWEWHAWDHLIQDQDPSRANYGDVAAHPERLDVNFGQDQFSDFVRAVQAREKEARNRQALNALRSIGYLGSPAAGGDREIVLDWTHANAVAYNAALDQIMLSARSFHEFWIIDHSTTTAEAAGHTGGRSGKGGDLLYRWGNPQAYRAGTKADQRLYYQHDAHWIPPGRPGAGHVLLFNNGLGRPGGDYSAVEELVLPVDAQGRYVREPGAAYGPKAAVWRYTAPIKTDFSVGFMSGAQRLPNGNTLICDSESGTIFEVAPTKEVVWSYEYAGLDQSEAGGVGLPPSGSGASPRPQEILPDAVRDTLKLSPEQKKTLDELQRHVDAQLDRTLTPEQKQRLRPRSGAGGGGIGGFALPGQILSQSRQAVLKPTDAQKQQLAELQKAVDEQLEQLLTPDQKVQFQKIQDDFRRSGPQALGLGGPRGAGPNPAGAQLGLGPGGLATPPVSNLVFRAYRYGVDYPGLAGKDLRPAE
jgi:hypothetical protein